MRIGTGFVYWSYMRYLLILLLLTSQVKAQDSLTLRLQSQMRYAGKEMQRYYVMQYTGLAATLFGAGLLYIGIEGNNQGHNLAYAGGAFSTIGVGFTLFSHRKIWKAGSFLIGNQKIKPSKLSQ